MKIFKFRYIFHFIDNAMIVWIKNTEMVKMYPCFYSQINYKLIRKFC